MSLLASARKGFSQKGDVQMTGSISSNLTGDFIYFHSDGNDYRITFNGHHSSLKAYLKCPPVAAIINKKTKSFANGKTFILNKKGKAKEKEATGENAQRIRTLLAKPNPFQTQKEFEAQQYAYIQLYGFCIVLPIKPVGYDNTFAKKLWNIPTNMIDIEQTKKNWLLAESNKDVIKKIVLNFGDEKTELPVSDVYIIKDITPFLNSPVFPESRTYSLEGPINNTIGSYESRGKLIDFRGALGIISPDAKDVAGPVPLQENDKEQLQQDFLKYGIKRGQYQYIISNASVKFSQMGYPTKDLMLFEEIEDNIMRICDGYDFPYPIISNKDTNSLGGNKIGEAKTLLYQDAIIPESESICDQWASLFELDKYDLKIEKDYSHIAALQGDEQKKAAARKTRDEAMQIEFYNNLCTLNEWRIANGDDPLEKVDGTDFGTMYYYQLVGLGWKFGNTASNNSKNQNKPDEDQNTGENTSQAA